MTEDLYMKQLLAACRHGREDRFMDRMLLASVVECRGAERFRMVYQNLPEGELRKFYHRLWASEAKHGHIFVKMLLNYFEKDPVYKRLDELIQVEADILYSLELKPALH